MRDETNIAEEIERLEQKRCAAIAEEKTTREAAFLHSDKFPLHERIAGFPAVPLCLFHCDLLRMMESPFMPPFTTPSPKQLADFLWVISPAFNRDPSGRGARAKKAHYRKCRKFDSIAPQVLANRFVKWKWLRGYWERHWGKALAEQAQATMAIRGFIREALADRPPARAVSRLEEPDYYSDFIGLAATLMRNYHGLTYQEIKFLPLKEIYQFVKEIHEHHAAAAGQPALLENGSDDVVDEQLALLNQRN